jgi:hypothetical protein
VLANFLVEPLQSLDLPALAASAFVAEPGLGLAFQIGSSLPVEGSSVGRRPQAVVRQRERHRQVRAK